MYINITKPLLYSFLYTDIAWEEDTGYQEHSSNWKHVSKEAEYNNSQGPASPTLHLHSHLELLL
jgi:hypothetical protein